MSQIEESGGVGGARSAKNYMFSDARAATEAKMAAEIAANKAAKTNNSQNTNAGTSTNQNDYNKKSSDERTIGQTNADGSYALGNNIQTRDQADFGNSDGEASSKGGKKITYRDGPDPKGIDFGNMFKQKFDGNLVAARTGNSIVNKLSKNPEGIKDLHTNEKSAENITNALASIHAQDGQKGLDEVNKNLEKKIIS